ncbi:MAG: N-formylglutamate amidohydrolase [Hyphomicrobiaceae bacterium]
MTPPTCRRPVIAAEISDSYTIVPGPADAGLVLLCDHARNAFPPEYGTLGLPPEQLKRHIAYDIGAEAITRRLAAMLGAPAIHSHYSRLLIDPNRGADDPTLVMRLSDGAIVPGNRNLSHEERDKRIRLYWRPYRDAIDRVLDQCLKSGVVPAVLSIHSFTESWKGVPRPWHVGVLWDKDARFPAPLLEAFYAEHDLIVGDNEPYKGCLEGDTMWTHCSRRGLAHALIEVRQDLIRDEAGQQAWAERIARIIVRLLADPEVCASWRRVEASR